VDDLPGTGHHAHLPRAAIICAVVSLAFRAAADSDHIWDRFLPVDLLLRPAPIVKRSKKVAYLGLCDAKNAAGDDEDGGCRVRLEQENDARCCAMKARRLSLLWDDSEFSCKWMAHP
jgi:hypothetical protein